MATFVKHYSVPIMIAGIIAGTAVMLGNSVVLKGLGISIILLGLLAPRVAIRLEWREREHGRHDAGGNTQSNLPNEPRRYVHAEPGAN